MKPQIITSQNVLDNTNSKCIFMVWNINEIERAKNHFPEICKLIINLNNSAKIRFPLDTASVVFGIGFEAWKTLDLPTPLPKELKNFEPIDGEKHTAVSTKGDFHFQIRAREESYCIDLATAISNIMSNFADCVEEIHGFKYWDGRTILGFVDGTENPEGDARKYFGIIDDEDPNYKGGSYLFVQKYIHNINAWNHLPIPEQEKVIGRSKRDDIEMSDEEKPTNSHSALANIGDDRKIVRDNLPFGTVANNEMGTYFIAYASTFSTVEKMLYRMFVGEPKGNYDRILDFSTAKTGSLFFVPTKEMLNSFTD